MAVSLPNYRQFDASEDPKRGERWEKWLAGLEMLFTGIELDAIEPEPSKDLTAEVKKNVKINKRRRALLLHYRGEDLKHSLMQSLQQTREKVLNTTRQ